MMMLPNISTKYRSPVILWGVFFILLNSIFFGVLPLFADDINGFQRLLPEDYPQFEDDLNLDQLAKSIQGSIDYFDKQSPLATVAFGEDQYSYRHLARSLNKFLAFIETCPDKETLKQYITENYYVYANVQRQKPIEVLFTGYYEPLLNGSRTQTSQFKFPVYGRPSDLVIRDAVDVSKTCPTEKTIGRYIGDALVPYYTRKEIAGEKMLPGKAPVIAWVDDPIDLFFLHVQGSGKIRLVDGQTISIHFLISNGHHYQSIGKYLIEKGRLAQEEVSMQSIRHYLKSHPDEMDEIFNYNPRYVFFEEVGGGPIGCFNIELTPGRSVALDKKQYPPACIAFIQTRKPLCREDNMIEKWVDFSRFVMNQDTGTAIVGPARADIFWGHDEYAILAAGYMKQAGRLYFLVLKPDYAKTVSFRYGHSRRVANG
ncbi:MAG: MltA domain-containing protein [Desulfobacterales bacterium]|jgi:membrane-bound lytic murein transglycosylase A|nr:MltA domain-containing protein [Desulfobacterales bacterium]